MTQLLSEYCTSHILCTTEQIAPAWPVFVPHAGRRHDDDAAAAVHPGGDGPRADGEESVQREADGAAGGRAVDGDDQVDGSLSLKLALSHMLICVF